MSSSIALNRTSEKMLRSTPTSPSTDDDFSYSPPSPLVHTTTPFDLNLIDNLASDPLIATEMETHLLECFPFFVAELINLAPFTADVGEHLGSTMATCSSDGRKHQFKFCLKADRVGYPLDEMVPNPTLIVLDERYGNKMSISSATAVYITHLLPSPSIWNYAKNSHPPRSHCRSSCSRPLAQATTGTYRPPTVARRTRLYLQTVPDGEVITFSMGAPPTLRSLRTVKRALRPARFEVQSSQA
ncbi:hypothetical protein BJ912DRAFT_923262 [Pholiota molesta]|nr:hypothetical protein BJ912DRAFT_923262 [Pholiota molesta]